MIVISGASDDKNVFRAWERCAVDFVVKAQTSAERRTVLANLGREKLDMVRSRTPGIWSRPPPAEYVRHATPVTPAKLAGTTPSQFVAIAASTGGPTAITTILSRLKAVPTVSVMIAQHMPDNFTRTFA